MSDYINRISQSIIEGNINNAASLTEEALVSSISPQEILDLSLIPAMDYVGSEFRNCNLYVPEVLLSARAMRASLGILKPKLTESGGKMVGKILIGTVQGDLHDIGKNLVGMMLEGAGFEVIDLGSDVTPEVFVNAIRDKEPDLVGMSALLTTTMPAMGHTIDAIKKAGSRDQVKIMIGGAPVTKDFAETIGADAYAGSAPEAVIIAKELVGVS